MFDPRVGAAFRAVRVRLGWRQSDLAAKAHVSSWLIKKIERGDVGGVRVDSVKHVGESLGIKVIIDVRWRGGELDRLLNARHSALHESVARYLSSLPGWIFEPEVSFAVWGERGIVDVLAWHARRGALLLIELKTQLVDLQEVVGTLDRKRRLARQIAAERGWTPRVVGAWLLIADTATNRRRVAAHREMLRAAFPADGRAMRRWLREPDANLRALSFWSESRSADLRRRLSPGRRVRISAPGRGHEGDRVATEARSGMGAP